MGIEHMVHMIEKMEYADLGEFHFKIWDLIKKERAHYGTN